MPYGSIAKDTSPEALASLDEELAIREAKQAELLQDELGASAFAQRCAREWADLERVDRAEHLTSEILEVVVTPGVGALAAWKTKGNFPIGAAINIVVGVGGKALSIWNPDNRGLRVLGRVGKTMLHSQLTLTTHKLIQGEP